MVFYIIPDTDYALKNLVLVTAKYLLHYKKNSNLGEKTNSCLQLVSNFHINTECYK